MIGIALFLKIVIDRARLVIVTVFRMSLIQLSRIVERIFGLV